MSDSVYIQIAELLNADPDQAQTMDIDQLRSVIQYADEAYYGGAFESPFKDKVYDLINDIYEQRNNTRSTYPKFKVSLKAKPRKEPTKPTKPKAKHKVTIASSGAGTDVDATLVHVPSAPAGSRLGKSPYWMGSMNKLNHGDGQLVLWKSKFNAPYIASAKMDGSSAMLFIKKSKPKLFTRGKTIADSQDISNLIPYIDLPKFPDDAKAIRGELIINLSVFNSSLKRSDTSSKVDDSSKKYKNARNAVPGITRHFATNDKIEPFYAKAAKLINFVAYEFIVNPAIKTSEQFKLLQSAGFKVPPHKLITIKS